MWYGGISSNGTTRDLALLCGFVLWISLLQVSCHHWCELNLILCCVVVIKFCWELGDGAVLCDLWPFLFNIMFSCDDVLPLQWPFMCWHSGIAGDFLLQLVRDVSPNPEPIQHLCTVCCRSVHSNQRALQCDKCQLWSHTKCVGIVDLCIGSCRLRTLFPGSVHHVCLLSFLPLR